MPALPHGDPAPLNGRLPRANLDAAHGRPFGFYVHIPFCQTRCGYCDFNTYTAAELGSGVSRGSYADTVLHEIRLASEVLGDGDALGDRIPPVSTVFFGGGTPTYLSAAQLDSLLHAILEAHPPVEGCEITSEANPGTVDIPKFEDMHRSGFNRISLGAQSFDSGDLMRLGRIHEPSHVAKAVGAARHAGFGNVNLDLMFALPGQSLRAWNENLRIAMSLLPEHLSLYCLTIEPNTRFYRLNSRGMLDLPDDDVQVEMYDVAIEACESHGYSQYEISNFAKPGFDCRHNLCYWRAEEYLGYGPGAVGCVETGPNARTRYTVAKHPERYCELVESGDTVWCETETLEPATMRLETIMLGVRLAEGLPLGQVPLDPGVLASLENRGWVTCLDERVRLTPGGRHFCSEVALALA